MPDFTNVAGVTANLAGALAFVWCGVVIGGAFIAAPAKFQARSLSLAVLLTVGRAQFRWLAIADRVLCLALLGLVLFSGALSWRVWGVVILVSALVIGQQVLVMPYLDGRTRAMIRGESLRKSHLHKVYVILEAAKVLSLLFLGMMLTRP